MAVRSATRIEPAMARRMFQSEGHGGGVTGLLVGVLTPSDVRAREERTLAGESMIVWAVLGMGANERWVAGHQTLHRGYHLEVGVALEYVGADGVVPAPQAWLIGTGGIVLRMLGAIGVPKDSRLVENPDLLGFLASAAGAGTGAVSDVVTIGARKRTTRPLKSGEDFAGTVLRYYFQVPEGIFPEQLRLAIEDVPPLRLPPISRVY